MAVEVPKNLPKAFWRPAGLIYLAFLIAGLACGLWPDWIFPPTSEFYTGPLPTLQALAVAQTAFILLVWPLVALRRHARSHAGTSGPSIIAETLLYTVATIPFYIAAGYLADATIADVVRSAVAALLLWPVGWAAGMLMARPGARPAVLVVMLVAALGLPGAYYIVREFMAAFGEGVHKHLWLLTPATFAWETAASRQPSAIPTPAWATVVWPVLAIAAMLLRLVWPSPAPSHQPS